MCLVYNREDRESVLSFVYNEGVFFVYYRYEVRTPEGEVTGFFNGILNIDINFDCNEDSIKVLDKFDGLKIPEPALRTNSQCWFTEEGNTKFKKGLNDVKKFFKKFPEYIIYSRKAKILGNIIYRDKYQVVVKLTRGVKE